MPELHEIKQTLLGIAAEFTKRGPGFAQEPVVLRKAAEKLGVQGDLNGQQRLLTVWHELFREGTLYWGYDIDNPSQPFFHFPERF